ncbi:hypothetical protein TorRG33x02_037430 [Trema orientale]|uniref:Uncharacterized protein n=1 Tax=Trema orientale TaxID=63057 RepID=A0A2P5FR94_TREOI|nr:hypothetical protein TorRG33x02_037430 [Trema orientale]
MMMTVMEEKKGQVLAMHLVKTLRETPRRILRKTLRRIQMKRLLVIEPRRREWSMKIGWTSRIVPVRVDGTLIFFLYYVQSLRWNVGDFAYVLYLCKKNMFSLKTVNCLNVLNECY